MSQGGERMQTLPRRAPGGSASQLREPRQPFGSRSHIQAATPKIALDSARPFVKSVSLTRHSLNSRPERYCN